MYAQEPAPAAPPRPPVPPRPAGPPSAPGGGADSGAPAAFLPPPARSPKAAPSPGAGSSPKAAPSAASGRDGGSPWIAKPAEGAPVDPEALPPAYRAVHTGDWDYVSIDFGDGPVASNRPIPGQRTAPEDETGPGAGGDAAPGDPPATEPTEPPAAPGTKKRRAKKTKARKGKGGAPDAGAAPADGAPDAAGGPAKAGASVRRPSALLLLSAAVLIGGAVTGQLIAMLIGWALGYLSRQLSDLTRKVAVFGIPLMTISSSSLWFWGRAQGRWGTAMGPGEQADQAVWEAAPGVLRVAAVLSAVFLLLMSLLRRGGGADGAGR
ncbi:hypothetical protein ACFXAF_06170 [Kitasatospora sp. NPDC059463]|uniref:hypothetical protein n=1 Tax=Kitasatospora sp. NPDC059463 TaxID=3346842 RepID=UPI0036A8CE37